MPLKVYVAGRPGFGEASVQEGGFGPEEVLVPAVASAQLMALVLLRASSSKALELEPASVQEAFLLEPSGPEEEIDPEEETGPVGETGLGEAFAEELDSEEPPSQVPPSPEAQHFAQGSQRAPRSLALSAGSAGDSLGATAATKPENCVECGLVTGSTID